MAPAFALFSHLIENNMNVPFATQALGIADYNDTTVAEKRLLRDLHSIKEMVRSGEIVRVAWVPGNEMLADALTKYGASSEGLMKCVRVHAPFCCCITVVIVAAIRPHQVVTNGTS